VGTVALSAEPGQPYKIALITRGPPPSLKKYAALTTNRSQEVERPASPTRRSPSRCVDPLL